jgi:hypothetical protein
MKLLIHASVLMDRGNYNEKADAELERVGTKIHSPLVMLEREAYAIGEYTDLDCRLQAA